MRDRSGHRVPRWRRSPGLPELWLRALEQPGPRGRGHRRAADRRGLDPEQGLARQLVRAGDRVPRSEGAPRRGRRARGRRGVGAGGEDRVVRRALPVREDEPDHHGVAPDRRGRGGDGRGAAGVQGDPGGEAAAMALRDRGRGARLVGGAAGVSQAPRRTRIK